VEVSEGNLISTLSLWQVEKVNSRWRRKREKLYSL